MVRRCGDGDDSVKREVGQWKDQRQWVMGDLPDNEESDRRRFGRCFRQALRERVRRAEGRG